MEKAGPGREERSEDFIVCILEERDEGFSEGLEQIWRLDMLGSFARIPGAERIVRQLRSEARGREGIVFEK